jgi:hypothetical protein
MGKFYCRISGPLGGRTVRGVRLTESFAGLTGLLVPLHGKENASYDPTGAGIREPGFQ